jgi:hypothetical protein
MNKRKKLGDPPPNHALETLTAPNAYVTEEMTHVSTSQSLIKRREHQGEWNEKRESVGPSVCGHLASLPSPTRHGHKMAALPPASHPQF